MNDEFSSAETGTAEAHVDEPAVPSAVPAQPIARIAPIVPMAPGAMAPAEDAARSAGELIRAARQAQGIDLASLAAMLKIPLRKLEALEEGRHTDLPGQTFERALAQAACRVLKIDPRPVLELLPQLQGNSLERMGGGINAPLRERMGRSDSGESPSLLRPIFILPVLLALGALALFFLPPELIGKLPRFGLGEQASAPTKSSTTETISVVAPSPPGTLDPAPPAQAAASPVQDQAPAPQTSLARVEAPAAAAAAVPPASAGVDEVLAHPSPAPTIPVEVVAAEASWIEIVDAQGHTLLSRTVVAGESVGLDGALPMKVKIGNARSTRLTLHGENVDLTNWTRDNVARLELK